jgi:predicted dehydrogenase
MRLALVGAGNVADRYGAAIGAEPELELAGATDLDGARAEALVVEHGGRAYADLDAVLADDGVDTIVNLTVPQAHFGVAAAALAAGKHVHSEKPLALAYDDARRLLELAGEHGVRLSSAPTTLLGEAQQTLWKHVRDDGVGTVRAAYAEANWPVRLVRAYATTLEPERALLDGTAFTPEAPDFIVAVLEHESGVVTRLTASFYVGRGKQTGIEVHGDEGSLHLRGWMEADSPLELQQRGGEYAEIPPLREPFKGTDWGRALVDLARAIDEGRPHRAAGEHAAHVVEILNAVESSASDGGTIAVTSEFTAPEPMDWAR